MEYTGGLGDSLVISQTFDLHVFPHFGAHMNSNQGTE